MRASRFKEQHPHEASRGRGRGARDSEVYHPKTKEEQSAKGAGHYRNRNHHNDHRLYSVPCEGNTCSCREAEVVKKDTCEADWGRRSAKGDGQRRCHWNGDACVPNTVGKNADRVESPEFEKHAKQIEGRRSASKPLEGTRARVFTDMDDTVFCSGGWPGGSDKTCHKSEMYPGVLQFYLELSRGSLEREDPKGVIILSARADKLDAFKLQPNDPIVILSETVGKFNNVTWGFDVSGALYGKLHHFIDVRKTRKFERMGLQKFTNYLGNGGGEVPSFFVGDNGQGDVSTAKMMAGASLEAAGSPGSAPGFKHSFIHRVVDTYDEPAEKLTFFYTYAEAAAAAEQHGFISRAGRVRVLEAIVASALGKVCRHPELRRDNLMPCLDVVADPQRPKFAHPKTGRPIAEPFAASDLLKGFSDDQTVAYEFCVDDRIASKRQRMKRLFKSAIRARGQRDKAGAQNLRPIQGRMKRHGPPNAPTRCEGIFRAERQLRGLTGDA